MNEVIELSGINEVRVCAVKMAESDHANAHGNGSGERAMAKRDELSAVCITSVP